MICGKSLDGIPFTVDATNQIHCIEDFHKKFAPRCCVCKKPIMPEPGQEETVRVVALDRSFHIQCYKCEVGGGEREGRGKLFWVLSELVLWVCASASRKVLWSCVVEIGINVGASILRVTIGRFKSVLFLLSSFLLRSFERGFCFRLLVFEETPTQLVTGKSGAELNRGVLGLWSGLVVGGGG